jgi:tRNA A37 methylthiotransferase MiaB
MIGSKVEVIVQGESKLVSRQNRSAYPASNVELGWEKRRDRVGHDGRATQLVGRTRGDQVVCFDGNVALKGTILNVEITDAQNLTLFGRRLASTVAR